MSPWDYLIPIASIFCPLIVAAVIHVKKQEKERADEQRREDMARVRSLEVKLEQRTAQTLTENETHQLIDLKIDPVKETLVDIKNRIDWLVDHLIDGPKK